MIGRKSLLTMILIALAVVSLSGLQLLYAEGGEKPRQQRCYKHRVIRIVGTVVEVSDQGLTLRANNRTITVLCKGSWVIQVNKTRKPMKWDELATLIDVGDKVTIVGVPMRGKIRALIIIDKDKEFKAISTVFLRHMRTRHVKPTGVKAKIEGSVGKKARVGFILVQDTGRVLVFCAGKWKKETGEVISHIDLLKELETKDEVEVEGKILIIHHKGRAHIAVNAEKIVDLTKGTSFTRVKD